MKYFRTSLIIILLIPTSQYLPAQSAHRTISGVVTSFEESLPLEGVKVSVKGTAKSSGTQADGIYYISINTEDSVLVFSLPGYEAKEVKITKSGEYNVTLHAGDNQQTVFRETEGIAYHRCRPWLILIKHTAF